MDDYKEFEKSIKHFNVLKVKGGTNCPQGGDSGHGGVTKFRLTDLSSTAWELRFKEKRDRRWQKEGDIESVELVFYGDAEAITFIEALEVAAKNLRKSLKEGEERQRRYSNYIREQKELEKKYKWKTDD
ncbi:MAG: hypothetical protein ACOC1K_03075 [Nanoarchaeota archaeon]